MKNRYSFLLFLGLFLVSGVLIWKGFERSVFPSLLTRQETVVVASLTPQVLGVKESTPSAEVMEKLVQVTHVVDGDTIEVSINGQLKKVRFIGINTPETVDPRRPVQCFGKQASNETKRLLEGKKVMLTKDISDVDKYNRLLRLVYLPVENGEMLFVNDYLVRQGFANNYTYPPDIKFDSQFRLAEKEARESNRGLWAACH